LSTSNAIEALFDLIDRADYRNAAGEMLRDNPVHQAARLAESEHGPAGPHPKMSLMDPLATPGTGMLPEPSSGKDADLGSG
jgi:hypothetical protein